MPSVLDGKKIVVTRPATVEVRRSLSERLFSRPWEPFKKTKTITTEPLVAPDKAVLLKDTLYVGEKFHEMMVREMRLKPTEK